MCEREHPTLKSKFICNLDFCVKNKECLFINQGSSRDIYLTIDNIIVINSVAFKTGKHCPDLHISKFSLRFISKMIHTKQCVLCIRFLSQNWLTPISGLRITLCINRYRCTVSYTCVH